MKVLMVCLGNICRSPLAEGIMKELSHRHQLGWEVDSAGTSGFHNGQLPDSRSIEVAEKFGIDITDQRSRKFVQEDFDRFDKIYVMDSSNYRDITAMAQTDTHVVKVDLILNVIEPYSNRDVPDPYFAGGFESVYTMLLEACEAIIKKEGIPVAR